MSWSRFVCPHCHFNSRPSARGDLLRGKYAQGVHNFNSRPSARGDVLHVVYSFHSRYFNSRPSARGDRKIKTIDDPNDLFQFTPLREGRQNVLVNNFTRKISIHAPPRGATCGICQLLADYDHFNSRPSARGDALGDALGISGASVFQFTPLREGRQSFRRTTTASGDFNSRPSARGDSSVTFHVPLGRISIHAPPRGATDTRVGIPTCNTISIHAPPRGATPSLYSPHAVRCDFNSRPSARGD